MVKSAGVERWFASTKPPSEVVLRRVRDIILGADASMRERIQYGITFSSTKSGDFAAFVRYSEPGVNLRLMRQAPPRTLPAPRRGNGAPDALRDRDGRDRAGGGAAVDGQGMVRARRCREDGERESLDRVTSP